MTQAVQIQNDTELCNTEPLSSSDLLKNWAQIGLLLKWAMDNSEKETEELSSYIEEKATGLVDSFRNISHEAKQQSDVVQSIVNQATNVIVEHELVPITDVIDSLDKLITTIIQDTVDVSKKAMNMIYVMRKVSEDAQTMNENLAQIFRITRDTKYLSINASIEAARAGEYGEGFAVVANEVGELSQNTQQLADSMGCKVTSFMQRLDEGLLLLEEIASKDLTAQINAKEHIDLTLDAMVAQAHRQETVLSQTVEKSDAISRDVSRLIMDMQFQDYAKQRMQHLVTVSQSLQKEVERCFEETVAHTDVDIDSAVLSQDIVEDLLDKFSLSSLKNKFLNDHIEKEASFTDENSLDFDAASNNSVDDGDDDIELF